MPFRMSGIGIGKSPPVWMGRAPILWDHPSHFAPTFKCGATRNAKLNKHYHYQTIYHVCMPSRIQSSPEPPCA